MKRILIPLVVLAVLILGWAWAKNTTHGEVIRGLEEKVHAAELARDASAKAAQAHLLTADEWRARAVVAEREADRLGDVADGLRARLAATQPPQPPSGPGPEGVDAIASGFVDLGIPPATVGSDRLAFLAATARPLLALARDGRAYPAAYERAKALEGVLGAVEGQLGSTREALASRTEEVAQVREAYADQLAATESATAALQSEKAIVAEKDKQIEGEKRKRRLTLGGAILAVLAALAL